MKSIVCASITALLLVSLALPSLTLAGAEGPSANGSFQFSLADGDVRYLEFNARIQNNGSTVGEMTFTDPAAVPVTDPDNPTATNNPGAVVRGKFDCLKITENRAVMGGVIVESNIAAALGLRILLVVEDNGEGVNSPTTDKLTWGVYQSGNLPWIPKDAERDDDNGASLSWTATDAERPDLPGVSSNQSKIIGCESFPLVSYSFVDVARGGGNIQVKP
jgi:hypothetical protein